MIIDKTRYYEHRIIAAITQGKDPGALTVDHLHAKSNAPKALQTATQKENVRRKSKLPSNNTSGVLGVWWHSTGHKWVAQIKVDGHKIHLGMHTSLALAARARRAAEKQYFGRFAPAIEKRRVQDATMDSLAHKPIEDLA